MRVAFAGLMVALAFGARASKVTVDHVERVGAGVVARLGSPLASPPAIAESANASARVTGGRLELSTGLLAILDSDAQLATVIAYEAARARPRIPSRRGSAAPSTGSRVARAAATGAVTGAVAYGVHDAMRGSAPIVRGATTGAATAASGAAMSAAWPRRSSETTRQDDDAAVRAAVGAMVAAGYDGSEAVRVWERLIAATPLGAEEGGYADRAANEERLRVARRSARRLEDGVRGRTGRLVGRESYREGVLSQLTGFQWKAAPAGSEPRPESPPMNSGAWITFARSGGIAGWRDEVQVTSSGAVTVSQSRKQAGAPRIAERLTPAEGDELRAAVEQALALPARVVRPEARYLRDGFTRTLTVRTKGRPDARVDLSDGRELAPSDQALVQRLEALFER